VRFFPDWNPVMEETITTYMTVILDIVFSELGLKFKKKSSGLRVMSEVIMITYDFNKDLLNHYD
jgi:hypothetical protein